MGMGYWVTRATLQKNSQVYVMINILKTLSAEINKGDYKCKHKFFKKRATDTRVLNSKIIFRCQQLYQSFLLNVEIY